MQKVQTSFLSWFDSIRVSNMNLLEDFEEAVDGMRTPIIFAIEAWQPKSMFHTYIKCGDKFFKLVVDGGSSINVVSESLVPRSKL